MNLPLLYKLQELHREMDGIARELRELADTTELKKLREEYQRLGEDYHQAEDKLKRNQIHKEQTQDELKNLQSKRKACEDIKFSRETDTVKKLDNIEKQLIKLDEKSHEAENVVIELEKDAENINKSLTETKRRLAFIKKKYLGCKEAYERSREELKARQSDLAGRIGEVLETVDTESFETYNRLAKSHPYPISLVENRKCNGCKMEVPSMDMEALKEGSREIRCQSCGRLLFYVRP